MLKTLKRIFTNICNAIAVAIGSGIIIALIDDYDELSFAEWWDEPLAYAGMAIYMVCILQTMYLTIKTCRKAWLNANKE